MRMFIALIVLITLAPCSFSQQPNVTYVDGVGNIWALQKAVTPTVTAPVPFSVVTPTTSSCGTSTSTYSSYTSTSTASSCSSSSNTRRGLFGRRNR